MASNSITLAMLDFRLEQGWRIKSTQLSETFGIDAFHAEHVPTLYPCSVSTSRIVCTSSATCGHWKSNRVGR
jgi:hypothetical protein